MVAKWQSGLYETDGHLTSWVKVRTSEYTQMTGRRELSSAGAIVAVATGARRGWELPLRRSR
jgi:hypothetical protein